MIYKIWLFLMDSEKGKKKYWDKCEEEEQSPKYYGAEITFAPYPGRFKWREWKITKSLKNWKLRRSGLYEHINLKIKTTPFECKPRELKGVKWKAFPKLDDLGFNDIEKELVTLLTEIELKRLKEKNNDKNISTNDTQ